MTSEVAFNFRISPEVALFAIGLAIVAGVIGGLLPAISPARKVLDHFDERSAHCEVHDRRGPDGEPV